MPCGFANLVLSLPSYELLSRSGRGRSLSFTWPWGPGHHQVLSCLSAHTYSLHMEYAGMFQKSKKKFVHSPFPWIIILSFWYFPLNKVIGSEKYFSTSRKITAKTKINKWKPALNRKIHFSYFSFTLVLLPHLHFWRQRCGFHPPRKIPSNSLWNQLGVLQVNPILRLTGGKADCAGEGLNPVRLPPPSDANHQVVSSQVTHNFCSTWLQIRGSHEPPLGFDYLQEQFTKLRETHLPFILPYKVW